MQTKKIKIQLLSDTCVSDGSIYNSAVDTDICYDDYGFPYIPGKRIRGCLRECAMELNDWGADIKIRALFGEQGDERGQVIIKNAYIQNRRAGIELLQQLSGTPFCHPQMVLDCYTGIRTQTALNYELGAADDQSLRTMRVIQRGLIFEAEVIFLSEDATLPKDLQNCLSVFRHIGLARTRGLGEIKAALVDENAQENDSPLTEHAPYRDGANRLEYEIYLNEPVICKSVGEQEAASMDYLEGAKILGLLGQRLKEQGKNDLFVNWLQEGKIRCSNVYLSEQDRRLYEMPASVFGIKNDKTNYRNKIYQDRMTPDCDAGQQLNQAKHRYVSMTEDGKMIQYSVDMENRYHHSRPEDKSVGRAVDGAAGGQMYQISAIKDNQRFRGFIEGDPEVVHNVYELLVSQAQCQLGYGRSGEYGGCTLRVVRAEHVSDSARAEVNAFYVLLKAPAIIYNARAMYSTDVEDLQEEILAGILKDSDRESGRLADREVASYVNITTLGGYHVTWGCRKPTIRAFDKGTVLVFYLPKDCRAEIRTGQLWIGERCTEGFGEAVVCPLDSDGVYQGRVVPYLDEREAQSVQTETVCDIHPIRGEELIQKMLKKHFEEFLHYKASDAAGNLKQRTKIRLTDPALKPTVSNMILMCRESASVQDVRKICQDRFGKGAAGKDKKMECAEALVNHVENLPDLVWEFEEQSHITGMYDEDRVESWKLTYLTELLIQIKYAIRNTETGEVDRDVK